MAEPARRASRWARARRYAAWCLVTLVGLALVWPAPLGHMPYSADHPVHLTRAWMFAEALSHGRLHDWSPIWFFGTPVGDLYPVLGDLVIVAVRVLGGPFLSWPSAYAIAFSLVFVAQGWALLRAGARLGYGRWPGFVAAVLVLLDVGAYREGGWIYTVEYGVWPQSLATALGWWAIAELAHACRCPAEERRRGIARASLAMGASLLAHPMSMFTFAIAGPLVVFAVGRPLRTHGRDSLATGVAVAVLAVGTSLVWVGPMLQHRAWMASYGWLWLSLDTMVQGVGRGAWSQAMPPLVGWAITLGLLATPFVRHPIARAYAVVALVLWALAARDVAWALRLDRLSEGFTHLQYQRLITAAKPGLFLLAGLPAGLLAQAASRGRGRWRAAIHGLAGLVALAPVGAAARAWVRDPMVRTIQVARDPSDTVRTEDFAALAAWLAERWSERDAFWRVTVQAGRNQHWFMDLPVATGGVPLFKLGFTPGDNFVHKPEQGHPAVLDRAAVRYVISTRVGRGSDPVARFGALQVHERETYDSAIARLDGPGTLEILEGDDLRGPVRVRVQGAEASTRLGFAIAGYPRWVLEGPDGAVPWVEAPVYGDAAPVTPEARRAGALRGGKAHGDDGREPTLLQAPVRDGEYTLRYAAWTLFDAVCAAVSLVGLAAIGALAWARGVAASRRAAAMHEVLRRVVHPAVVLSALVVVAGVATRRIVSARATEARTAMGRVSRGDVATLRHLRANFLKTDMLIRPALLVDRRPREPATVVFPGVPGGTPVTGWVALDDDEAQVRAEGTHRFEIAVRDPGGAWTPVFARPIPHRPGMLPIAFTVPGSPETRADVRVTVHTEGRRPPRLGFDLDLALP